MAASCMPRHYAEASVRSNFPTACSATGPRLRARRRAEHGVPDSGLRKGDGKAFNLKSSASVRRKTMEYRLLGRSGLKVSPICLGTMMFGGRTDALTSERIIAKGRAAGINFIDTADAYNDGRSEEVVGGAIGKQRDSWVLASKLSNPMAVGPKQRGLSRKWV